MALICAIAKFSYEKIVWVVVKGLLGFVMSADQGS